MEKKKELQTTGFDLQKSNLSKGMDTNGIPFGLNHLHDFQRKFILYKEKLKIWGPQNFGALCGPHSQHTCVPGPGTLSLPLPCRASEPN
jgi:hypothetical protein